MAIDPALIKISNIVATSPSGRETRVPTAVTQITGQQIWKYDFIYPTWPETGNWTVAINEDGFSLTKGTIVGGFPIAQGSQYSIAINWESTETVTRIASRVTTLETNNTADRATIAQLRSDLTAAQSLNTTQTNNITALTTRVDTLVTRIDDLEAQVAVLTP